MLKLKVAQNNIEYHGFFTEPAFDLMGDIRALLKLLHTTFSVYGVGLANFRLDGEASEPSSAAAYVRLGLRGSYKFKFDQVQAALNDFNSQQLAGFVETLQIADDSFRNSIPNLSFKTHIFFYTGHTELSEGTSTDFLLSLPIRDITVPGKDLGSGIIQSWSDPDLGAKVSFTVDHSLLVKGGLFINYRVIIDRDKIDYLPLAMIAQQRLYAGLANLGLVIEEEEMP